MERIKPVCSVNPELWDRILSLPNTEPASDRRPFIQLAAQELPGEEVDEILAYAGMPDSDGPIGLPLDFKPLRLGDSRDAELLFPLNGLEDHLRNVAGDILAALDHAGSMDAFVQLRGDELTAREYLIAGVAECIRFCRQQSQALVIRW